MKNQVSNMVMCSDPRDIMNHYLRVKVLNSMTRLLEKIEQDYKESKFSETGKSP